MTRRRVRSLALASAATLLLLAIVGVHSVGAEDTTGAQPACKGLACAKPGSRYYVPEARNVRASLGGPEQLAQQTTAGFYEYSPPQPLMLAQWPM